MTGFEPASIKKNSLLIQAMMEAASSCKMLVNIYQIAKCNISKKTFNQSSCSSGMVESMPKPRVPRRGGAGCGIG
jgi:hypothetical protein